MITRLPRPEADVVVETTRVAGALDLPSPPVGGHVLGRQEHVDSLSAGHRVQLQTPGQRVSPGREQAGLLGAIEDGDLTRILQQDRHIAAQWIIDPDSKSVADSKGRPGLVGGRRAVVLHGCDPRTGRPEPGRLNQEAEIFSGLLGALRVDTAGSGLPSFDCMVG